MMHDILIGEKILSENDHLAKANSQAFAKSRVFAINLVSSPGAGKTTLLEKVLPLLIQDGIKAIVVEGDLETDLDAKRIKKLGIPVRQITTGKSCHLDAHMISHELGWIDSEAPCLLVMENVGNMVCPAEFDLGEDIMIAMLGATEGEDKPLKYPYIFNRAGALVINKTDLLPYTDFSVERARKNALLVNPRLNIFETSSRSGDGIAALSDFIKTLASKKVFSR